MGIAHLALGSNLGDRSANLAAAVRRLRAEPGMRVVAVSRFYETAPIGCPPGSGDFLNAAATIETDRSPEDLLQLFLEIERQFGRVRDPSGVKGPRTLDLDLLLYDGQVLNKPDLILPHPRMHERAFVIVPLAEIAPEALHPVLGKTIQELGAEITSRDDVREQEFRASSSGQLNGLRCLVTGSTSGIGQAIASTFDSHGATVITHGRRSGPEGARCLLADLRDPAQVDQLANAAWQSHGGLDVLVCNAGADTLTGDGAKASFDEKLEALLAVDLKATMRLARGVGAQMKAQGHGSIITIGWDQAETGMEGDSGQLFAAIKGAVMCFTRSLALTLAPEVRVNCIAPGWIRTAWGETASHLWQERVRRETPLGVWGLPEDIAEAALWLASPSARFITGQTIRVNGGVVR